MVSPEEGCALFPVGIPSSLSHPSSSPDLGLASAENLTLDGWEARQTLELVEMAALSAST